MKKIIAILALALLLSACGFHIRGNYQLPPNLQTVKIQTSDPYGAITREISSVLRNSGIKIVDNSNLYTATLQLGELKIERKLLSIYQNGQNAEFNLYYTMPVTVIQPNKPNKNIVLEVQRIYQDDPQSSLAKSRESEILQTEMQRHIAEQLIAKLAAE